MLFLALIVFVFSMVGCRKVEPVTTDDFQTKMESMGYKIEDVTGQYSEFPHVKKCLVFENDNEEGKIHVEFFDVDSIDNARGMYSNNKKTAEEKKGSVSSESTVSNDSHSKYKLTTSDTYYIVEQVGNTFVYAYCSKDIKSKLNDVIDELKY